MGQLTKNEIFALAVQRYSDTVFRAAMHNCSCTADAEDVVQDVFEKLLCYNGRFESEEHLKAYLIRSTVHRCRSLASSAYARHTSVMTDEAGETDDGLSALHDRAAVTEAVRALPPKQRDVVYLFYYERCSVAETAKLLGRRESAVKTALQASGKCIPWQVATVSTDGSLLEES